MTGVRYIVGDVERAAAFYRDLLGFTVERLAPRFATLSRQGLRLYLNAPGAGGAGRAGGTPEPGGWNRFQLAVHDLASEVTRLRGLGAAFRGDVVTGRGGKQVLLEDPAGNAIELFEPAGVESTEDTAVPAADRVHASVLLDGERTGGHVSITEITVPPRSAGPPLHRHDFDEAFYMLEGELVFQLHDSLVTRGAGAVFFAPRNVPHALANAGDEPARYLLTCTPAGFERHWARMAADSAGMEAPPWAREPIPEVAVVGSTISLPV